MALESAAGDAPPGARSRRGRLKDYGLLPLTVLFILNAVDEFDRAVLAVALEPIRKDFGLSDLTVGLLPLAVIFITGVISLPAGNWSDRWNRVNILSAGAMVWGTAGLFAAASTSFVQLFLTRALLGFGQGTIVLQLGRAGDGVRLLCGKLMPRSGGGLDGIAGPAQIDGSDPEGHEFEPVLSQSLGELLSHITAAGIRTLESHPPTLEQLFLEHYGSNGSEVRVDG